MEKSIHISGEIGFDNTPTSVKEQIDSLNLQPKDTLRVILNSEGGSVFDGFEIYNHLKALSNEITTEVRGMAASIASLIMLAGDTIEIGQAATVMIHRSMTMAMGNSEDIEKQVNVLNTIDSILIDIFSARMGIDKEEAEEKLSEETWFTGEEAVEAGLADKLINKMDAKMVALLSITHKRKIMDLKKLWDKLGKLNQAPDPEEEAPEEEASPETPETPEVETPEAPEAENITREEFNVLVEALQAMEAAISELQVDSAIPDEEEEEPAEDTPAEEEEETALLTEEQVDAIVDKKVRAIVKNLKKSNGQPPKGNNSLSGGPDGYVDKYAGFRAKLAEIDSKTRN